MTDPTPKAEFDACATDYDEQLKQGLSVSGEDKTYFIERRIDWMIRRLGPLSQELNVMDFGCGTGSAVPYLLEKLPVASVVGLDTSASSLDVARKRVDDPRVSYSLIEPFQPNGAIDLAYCNGVFHHIPPEQRLDSLALVMDALRPGGYFALWENNPWNPGTRWVMSRIPFDRDAITLSPPECQTLVEAAGFEVLRRDALFIFPKVLGALRFMETWLATLPLGAQYMVLARKPL